MHPRSCTPCRSLLAVIVIALLMSPVFAAPKKGDSSNASKQPAAGALPAATGGAQWTLYCQAVAGPAHVEQAKAIKDQLIAATAAKGLKDWHVIHQESESVVYYGFYRTINEKDPGGAKERKEGQRAQSDRQQIAGMQDQQGNRIFDHVFFVELPAPDPEAPAEWNLSNANGFFTLQIAAYKDSPQRKQAAVDAVRQARAEGIEAYYYHGETTSSVCIGAWPRAAVREQEEAAAQTSENAQDQDILVLPTPLPNQEKIDVRNQKGQKVKTYAPRFEALDPTLMAAMEKYPTHSVNGLTYVSKVTDPATKEVKEVPDPSYVVEIPKPKANLLRQQPAAPALLAPPTPANSSGGGGGGGGGGKLKSLGDAKN